MKFTEIKYTKNVEGNFDVSLIFNNVVIATIPFPTEELAKEYVDIKQNLKAQTDSLIAQLAQNLQAAEQKGRALVEEKVSAVVPVVEAKVAELVQAAENKAEDVVNSIKARVEKAKPIDTSAKVGKDTVIDTSAKVGKDGVIDTSAKIVTNE